MSTRSRQLLPFELYEHIIDYLKDDIRSLRACSVVCYPLLLISRRHLFESMTLNDRQSNIFSRLLSSNHFPVSHFVRRLDLCCIYLDTSQYATLRALISLTELTISHTYAPSFVDLADWITSLVQLQNLSLQSIHLGSTNTTSPPCDRLLTSNLRSFICYCHHGSEAESELLSWLSPQVATRTLRQLRIHVKATSLEVMIQWLQRLPLLVNIDLRVSFEKGNTPCWFHLFPFASSLLMLHNSRGGAT
jgi:hypothetical protein